MTNSDGETIRVYDMEDENPVYEDPNKGQHLAHWNTAVSLMVGELSRKGLLERHEDSDDRRRRVISIPEAQRASVDAWLGDSAGAWNDVFATLTVTQRRTVVDALMEYERRLRSD